MVSVAVAAFLAVACDPPAPPAQLVISGHGFGHGRGMGQYGAYGYAVDQGWTFDQILDHYYRGTTLGTVPGNPSQRVFMRARQGQDMIVTQDNGALVASFDPSSSRPALRIQYVDDTRFRVYDGDTCAGPWTARASLVTAVEVEVRPANPSGRLADMVRLCEAGGSRYLRGSVLAVHALGTIETVNRIGLDDLTRDIIPSEMSPSWAAAGSGRGMNALQTQAVAARSYAAAGDGRWGSWATTCDDTYCQVYRGAAYRFADGSVNNYEDDYSLSASTSTAGQVRRWPGGAVVSTEFSASTGGWTAGGGFPAVVDDGDQASPYHDWTVTLSAAQVRASFSARQGFDVGALEGVEVLARNGYGAEGGRVTSVQARFANTTVTLTGQQFQWALNLRSDWFSC